MRNSFKMIKKFLILFAFFANYATGRTAKQFREMPGVSTRLTQAEYPYYNLIAPYGPGTYAFGFEVEDPATGNVQFRDEERFKNGTIKDHLGYRATAETKKKTDNGPLKIELQLQPTVPPLPQPGVISPVTDQQLSMDANIFPQKFHENLNVIDPFSGQQYLLAQNPFYRQGPYDNTVSTYSTPQSTGFPFFNWFNTNTNNNNNNNLYQDQQQPQRPILDFINNIATNNPITSFFNNFGQNSQSDQNMNQNPFQSFFNNINPFNIFNNNNNNNNNRPQVSLPITQGDYVPQSQGGFVQPSGQIDSSVFSNDHFLNPNTFYQNNPTLMPSNAYHQNSPLNVGYMSSIRPQPPPYAQQLWPQPNNGNGMRPGAGYPYEYYNPYNQYISPTKYTNSNKKTRTKSKRKKNKNKVDVPSSDSDWFQGFLDKRKELILDSNSRHSLTRSSEEDEDDDINLDEYFR